MHKVSDHKFRVQNPKSPYSGDKHLPSRPFEKVAMDIFYPFRVPTDRDNTHILTMVEICTRFTEAIL